MSQITRSISMVSRYADCSLSPDDTIVQSGLAVTPAKMQQMAARGVPVSAQAAGQFYDGEVNPSWEVPAERMRGVDIADLWETQANIKRKVAKAHKDAPNVEPSNQ